METSKSPNFCVTQPIPNAHLPLILCGRKGYTLIELIIVTTLISILTAIAIPNFPLLSGRQLAGTAWKIAGDVRLARSEAVITGQTCRITFYVAEGNYRFASAKETRLSELPEGITFPTSTTFAKDSSGNPYIQFNPLGRPSGGGTVTLQSESGEKRYIIVTPVTGRVRVSRDPP